MTYQEIRNELKALKEQGYTVPALNSKKEVLEAALNKILASIAELTEEVAAPNVTEPAPETTPTPKVQVFTTANQYPVFLTALATAIAFLQSLWAKTAPHLKRGIAYSRIRVIPRLAVTSKFVGLVAVLIVLKAVRRSAIA